MDYDNCRGLSTSAYGDIIKVGTMRMMKKSIKIVARVALVSSLLLFALVSTIEADVRVNSLAKLGFNDKQIERQPTLKYKGGGSARLRADAEVYPYQVPSNFGYAKLEAREKNNNDRSLRDNIDNEANQRNVAKEPPKDMTPCRQDEGRPRQALKLSAGDKLDIPLQFNNPHDGVAEVNLWRNAGSKDAKVATIASFDSGGGFSQNRPTVTLPKDAPECKPEDKCLIQYHWQSVEPRTYQICSDVEISATPGQGGAGADGGAGDKNGDAAQQKTGGAGRRALRYDEDNNVDKKGPIAAVTGSAAAAANNDGGKGNTATTDANKGTGDANKGAGNDADKAKTNEGGSVKSYALEFKDPIYYSDSFHTAHIDSSHSGYQGQNPDRLSEDLKARIYLNDATSNGGLLKDALPRQTIQARNNARNQVNAAIKNAEKQAIRSNKLQQKQAVKGAAVAALSGGPSAAAATPAGKGQLPTFEAERYNDVLNPRARRQYTNTYVTNVDAQKIADNLRPELEKKGLYPQSVAVKDTYTNTEVFGMKKNNLKNPENVKKLPDTYKQALGNASKKLLMVRSLGGDEETELEEDIAKHNSPLEIPAALTERAFTDPTEKVAELDLTEDEKNALLSASGVSDDSADLSSGESALDMKVSDDEDPGDNPDDANDDGANSSNEGEAE